MENIRDRVSVKHLETGEETRTMFSKPLYKDHIIFNDNLIDVFNNISSIKFDKPIHLEYVFLITVSY